MNALSLMLIRRYRAGGGTLPYFGSHRIRHGTATMLVNNGMALDEVSPIAADNRRFVEELVDAAFIEALDAR
jgi:hypothetical protein